MVEQVIKNNVVELIGKVVSNFEFSHEVYGEGFFTTFIEVPRLSKAVDVLPIMVSERLCTIDHVQIGDKIYVQGQFRSYNRHERGKNKLLLMVFARELQVLRESNLSKNPNTIYLDGFICKDPVYRTTPFGREIADILLAVNRPYNKSDYIPLIAWGRNAKFSDTLAVGDRVQVWGRIQSRNYQKKMSDEVVITKTAYEVSISKIEIIEADQSGEKET